jgi:uncharacterized membrane protein (DUF373 family)
MEKGKIERIKSHYDFTSQDTTNLRGLLPIMQMHREKFVHEFYHYVKNLEDSDKYLKNQEIVERHQSALAEWYMHLFAGDYGFAYFSELERVGMAHVNIGLDAHYVNASMHFVKRFMHEMLRSEFGDQQERASLMGSLDKILDINLDIFTSSYIDEEKRTIFLSHRLESLLIQSAKRFTYGLNLILVLGLVGLGGMVLWLVGNDLMHVFDGNIEKGLLATLGSLLMLWVIIELMDTEIEHLQGKKFAIKVFISVALVAMIRKILIATLAHDEIKTQLSLMTGLAVLGVVYWLISKADSIKENN